MVPCFLNLTLQPAVLSPQRSVASLLPYFSFFKLFSFMYLRTLPSSVSCKSFACHSYENGRGAYRQFPFRNSALSSRQPDPRLLRRRHQFLPLCAFCVLCDLCVKSLPFPFFRLSTLDSQPPPPSDLSPFFSHLCGLFCTVQNHISFLFMQFWTLRTKHPGWGRVHYKNEEKDGALPTRSGQVPVAATGGQPGKRRMPGATGRRGGGEGSGRRRRDWSRGRPARWVHSASWGDSGR